MERVIQVFRHWEFSSPYCLTPDYWLTDSTKYLSTKKLFVAEWIPEAGRPTEQMWQQEQHCHTDNGVHLRGSGRQSL